MQQTGYFDLRRLGVAAASLRLGAIEPIGGNVEEIDLPEVLPSFVANLFYAFDVNMRTAIGLGMWVGFSSGAGPSAATDLLVADALAPHPEERRAEG